MDFVQDRISTIHDVGDGTSPPDHGSFAAIVPMVGRELIDGQENAALEAITSLSPERVIVPIRADAESVRSFARWADAQPASIDPLWCNAPSVVRSLTGVGERDSASPGKGHDVWLAMGVAATHADVVCCFDADVTSLEADRLARLLAPISSEVSFTKAYYARIEGDRLYGRLFRLLYRPLVEGLDEVIDDPIVDYLASFRYALAGEFAVRSDTVLEWSFPVDMGLEVGLLGEAYSHVGFEGTAQVDLGYHRHRHRPVEGSSGLGGIAPQVTGAIFDVLDRAGAGAVAPQRLVERYRSHADRLIEQYRRDADVNGLRYDPREERDQVDRYAEAIRSPRRPGRMPPWSTLDLDPRAIAERSDTAIAHARDAA